MALLPKTPGSYIEEVVKFPPSIAPVETAIPAFIGYTQKADKISPGDLLLKNVPTKIGSIAEYELYFGTGASPTVSKVTLDDSNNFKSANINNLFYMYDSMRLFYANGGGDCYIVSTGVYDSAGKLKGDFTDPGNGISALEKIDEPTILAFPDNSLLTTGKDFYDVYIAAMDQCQNLQDRVGLFHVKENDQNGTEFRSGTGINNLKYGMAYSPWLNVNFPKDIQYRAFKDAIYKGDTQCNLADLTTDVTVAASIEEYKQVITDVNTINDAANRLYGQTTLRDKFNVLVSDFLRDKSTTNMMALVNSVFDVARELDTLVKDGGSISNVEFKTYLKSQITSTFVGLFKSLISYDKEIASKVSGVTPPYTVRYTNSPPVAGEWNGIFGASAPDHSTVITGDNNADMMTSILPHIRLVFDDINAAWLGKVVGAGQQLEQQKHESLLERFPLYKSILKGIQNTCTSVPPAGAVAGRYAYVDRTRGVWKAPANVSISNIIEPTYTFTRTELDALNVDANSGKSINAIRFFTGKGTLIFGARTLAGNDNEWRYINVRRFFNFVEESTKKATEQFVFEPNDANTWVRVQAMIENFLTVLWRQGALQGVKPEHAFYVAVGLGKTMTPVDILEGRMIVEIGMAVVRPAEFIILRFSHKMPES